VGCRREANRYRNLFKSFVAANGTDSEYPRLKIRQYLYKNLFSVLWLIKIRLGVERRDHRPLICWGPTKVATAEVAGGNCLEAGEEIVPRLLWVFCSGYLKKKSEILKRKQPCLDLSPPSSLPCGGCCPETVAETFCGVGDLCSSLQHGLLGRPGGAGVGWDVRVPSDGRSSYSRCNIWGWQLSLGYFEGLLSAGLNIH